MINRLFKSTFLFSLIAILSCGNIEADKNKTEASSEKKQDSVNSEEIIEEIVVGANRTELYMPMLHGKKVGLVGNQSSLVLNKDKKSVHLVDSLLALNVDLVKVFAPEHGFRGKADAGEKIEDGKDPKTGLPVSSLYGSNKKPKPEQLKDIDVLIFDLQDVGARFYTYISSLHYVM